MQNKWLVVFPDGVGIRNYLYPKIFDGKDDLVLFHNFDPKTIATLGDFRPIGNDVVIPDYRESVKEKYLRELICLARLYHNARITGNSTLLTNWNWKQNTASKRVFYKMIEWAAKRIRNYNQILSLEEKYQKAIRQNPFYRSVKAILSEVAPTKVFCTHQRGLKVAPIFAAATDLGIPTSTVIYSWDNLPKARMALRADQYLVWSEYMKTELRQYYPEIRDHQIAVTGTPQFEFYADKQNRIEKETFFQQFGLDTHKKIICYSGDDEKTSPDDPKYLRDIAEALIQSGLETQYQILFRRCPVDFSDRFDAVLAQYDSLIKVAPPAWHFNKSGGWTTAFPSYEDVKLLASTAFYADVVINVGSTMAFDFAMYDKPCVFINYDQPNKTGLSMEVIYQFQHFRSMENKTAVFWLNSKSEILSTIESALSTTTNPAMDAWKAKVLGHYQNASANIRAALQG